ncbi:phosphatase PAP2 family protein [Flavobacterium luteum]|uniref:Phosphatase PAP2 family protein n=1 Tax=Flavobacterium luteum TaxID=2026654 RepID=A0A7J5AKH2_9FLAO|nr:phosphatase PAP2 family protein [Flavobacterium luteum]KAB1158076.1 phosphatase PAP2 family protein [Flavobacterium luteum]
MNKILNYKRLISTYSFLFFQQNINAQQTFTDSIYYNISESTFANVQYDTLAKTKIQNYFNCDNNYIYQYSKPKFWNILKNVPSNIYNFGEFTIQKENIKWGALAIGSTVAIIPFDQQVLDKAGKLGNKMGGWDKDSQFDKAFRVFNIIPKNIPSAVYYIGNGGTTLLLSGVFYGIGKLNNNDLRALNTSHELVECIFSVGVATQTIKRITGRQSPVRALVDGNDGGAWNPFPSFKAFQSNTPNYDAMPSGHIATFMATITIISTNYPEIRWIKPFGYSLTGLIAFNMVSNKVHWTSDYPLGLFIGYIMGKQIANRRITKIAKNSIGYNSKENFYNVNYTTSNFLNTRLFGASITF